MDDELKHFLNIRETLLTSDSASVDQLKAHDRQLLVGLLHQTAGHPVLGSSGVEASELAGYLAEDPGGWLCVIEARDRIWPGELARVQDHLLRDSERQGLAWWLAAHYRTLACPSEFPSEFTPQVWAARAFLRRGYAPPGLWADWYAAIHGDSEPRAVATTLWAEGEGALWRQWLPPVLAAAHDTAITSLINTLAAQVTDETLIAMIGVSGHSRFLPWLASLRHDASLATPALREMRWLVGDREERHGGRQLWGRPLAEVDWQRLFRTLPLGFRDRLWPSCSGWIEGMPYSLQGGQWCAGN